MPVVYMPIEVKSARVQYRRVGDVFQLLTYCFLLDEEGHIVNRGRLVYDNAQFDIPYGLAQRQEVMRVLEEMREADKASLECFSAAKDRRCKDCGYNAIC